MPPEVAGAWLGLLLAVVIPSVVFAAGYFTPPDND
jgi:hypothetical protein